MKDFRNRLISGFIWESATRFIVQIVSWASTIWVARLLTPEDYGLVGISGIFTGLCLSISGMGLFNALINEKDVSQQQFSNIFWTGALLGLLFYFVLFVAAPVVANYYGSQELTLIIRIAAVMVLISPLTIVPRALVLRKMDFKRNALISMLANFLVTITALSMALLGFSYWALILSTIAGEIFIMVAFFTMVKFVPGMPGDFVRTLRLYRYGLNILGARLVSYLRHNLPLIILSSHLGKTAVGQYQIAHTVAGLPMSKIGEIFSSVAFPSFSRIKQDQTAVRELFLQMNSYLFLIIAPMFVGLAVTAPEFVPLVLGDQWLDAIVPIQIVCFANIISGSAMLVPRVLEGIGMPSASMKYESIIVIISPFAMLAGVGYGLEGLLLGWALAIPLGYIYLLRVLFKALDMNMKLFFDSLRSTGICLMIMLVALAILDFKLSDTYGAVAEVLMKVAVGGICFCVSVLIFDRNKINQISNAIKRP